MATDPNDSVRMEYDVLAARYDRIWARYIRASVRETLKRLSLRTGDQLLDVGCGTGAFLAELLSHRDDIGVAGVAGVDLSDQMLARARGKLGSSVDLRRGNAEDLPHADGSFHMVTSISMFHYLRDPLEALREAHRVLRPGGRILITDWCHDYLGCRCLDIFLRVFNRAHYHTYGVEELESFMKQAGFEDIQIESYKIDFLWGMMTASGSKPG
ncbi:MAG: methyltransferase domain-containing protein [Rhodospirillales bacterium]|nr:methyltransferase domain-containing protein [Rhodospirillales bacterium]